MLRQLARKGLFDLIAASAAMQAAGFAVLLVLPRFVEPSAYGAIRVLQSIGDVLVVLAGFGFTTAVLVTCAGPLEAEEEARRLGSAFRRTLLASGATWVLAAGLALAGAFEHAAGVARWLPVFALSAPPAACGFLLASWLQARHRIRSMARAQALVRIQAAALVLLAAWWAGLPGFVFASIGAALLGLVPLARLVGTGFLRAPSWKPPPLFFRVARDSVAGNTLQLAGRYADLFVLGFLSTDPEGLGHYALATVLAVPVFVLAGAIQATALPGLSAGRGDAAWIRRSVFRLQWETLLACAAAALALRIVAPYLIQAVYPIGYGAALPYLEILLVHAVLRSGTAILGAGNIALGRTGYNVGAAALSAAAGLAGGVVGLRIGGLQGVAWAQAGVSLALALVYPALFARAASRGASS